MKITANDAANNNNHLRLRLSSGTVCKIVDAFHYIRPISATKRATPNIRSTRKQLDPSIQLRVMDQLKKSGRPAAAVKIKRIFKPLPHLPYPYYSYCMMLYTGHKG